MFCVGFGNKYTFTFVCLFACLLVLGIRDNFIRLEVAKTFNTFNLGWSKSAMGDIRPQAFISGQKAEEESSRLYCLVMALFPICLHDRELSNSLSLKSASKPHSLDLSTAALSFILLGFSV